MLRVQRDRVELAIRKDGPRFTPMGREERVVSERYNEQDPHRVGFEIADATGILAGELARLSPRSWEREGLYSYPTEQVRSVEWIARNTVHEGRHHLMDMERQLDAQSGS